MRRVLLNWNGSCSSFVPKRIKRQDLYVARVSKQLDSAGRECRRASLTPDGLILPSGSTGSDYADEYGTTYKRLQLQAIDSEGAALPRVTATLDVPQDLEECSSRYVCDFKVDEVYHLSADHLDPQLMDALDGGAIFRCPYSFRDGWRPFESIIISNRFGVFALIGSKCEAQWCERPETSDILTTDGPIDFNMEMADV